MDVPVSICVPYLDRLAPTLTQSLIGLSKPKGTQFIPMPNLAVDEAREALVEAADGEWIFFMDSDQSFHPETLRRLLSREKDVISGVYFARIGYPVPHIYQFYRTRDKDTLYKPMVDEIVAILEKHRGEMRESPMATVLSEDVRPIEIDGCGLGCLLIRRSVFDKIERPWFERTTLRGGEDFDFCRKLKKAGVKIYVDPSVLCGHFVQEERGHRHFLSYFGFEPYPWMPRQAADREFDNMWLGETLIGDMAEYLGIPPNELIAQVEDSPQLKVAAAWNEAKPQSVEEIRNFYSTQKEYLIDLTMWNVSPVYRQIIGQIADVEGKVVLDFGAGLGSSTMWMLTRKVESVDYLDLPGVLRDFAQWRAKKHKVYEGVGWLDSLDGCEGKYNLIVAIDVLEHLPDLPHWLGKLAKCLKPKGLLFHHSNWSTQGGIYPQHYDWSKEWPALCAECGLKAESNMTARKIR